jgi:UDP-N-acetylmuramate dehydrogenase
MYHVNLQENIPLAPLTTFQVGGLARYFVIANTADEVREAVEYARERHLPLFILGGGSNLVISDSGWPGVVLKVGITGVTHHHGSSVVFDVGAGEEWDWLVAFTVSHQCAGLECLSGIPGNVGGTPVQNVGAYGQEVSETIESVEALDLKSLEVVTLTKEDCGFHYRTSIFNTTERGRYVILRVNYRLKFRGEAKLHYADLKKYFAGWAIPPTLAQVREAVREIRASKGMLIRPDDEDCRSAGSFFKNPVLTAEEHALLEKKAAERGLKVPSYPALEAQRKVSAAWLVEHSGFAKGYSNGTVGISRKHALALVNRGGAKAADIIAFKDEIQDRIEEIWGVRLQPEPVFVGF